MIDSISTGQAFCSIRKGAARLLGDNTCRAIARISSHSRIHGQWNPLCGNIMLRRGESKRLVFNVCIQVHICLY